MKFNDDGIHIDRDEEDAASKGQRIKAAIYRRYNGVCFYCKCNLTLEESTIDHFVPKAHGGVNAQTNLRLSCYQCNQKKDDQMPDIFLSSIYLKRKIVAVRWQHERQKKEKNHV